MFFLSATFVNGKNIYDVVIVIFFRRRSTDAVDNRGECGGERFDVDYGEEKRIGDAVATSSRHRADFRPRRVRRLALRKRMYRRQAAADQLTQEASVGTQLRASFTMAMRLGRRQRWSYTHACTHACGTTILTSADAQWCLSRDATRHVD